MKTNTQEIVDLFNSSETIVFLTGAGVSTDSGIPDFKEIDVEWPYDESRYTLTNIQQFHHNRNKFWEAFRYIFIQKCANIEPNIFHHEVAELEKRNKQVIVLTQNVDGLHQKAGSSQVLELHGNIREALCNRPSCGFIEDLNDNHNGESRCPKCRKFMRPNTVFFGEGPKGMGDAKHVSIVADLMVVAGTSLDVGPVNSLPMKRNWYNPEAKTLWVNRTEPPLGYDFTHSFQGELSEFSELLRNI